MFASSSYQDADARYDVEPTWSERIEQAHARGGFTAEEHELAQRWTDDATAELPEGIPRVHEPQDGCHGRPTDPELHRLGLEFSAAVWTDRVQDAREALKGIRERGREVALELYDDAPEEVAAPWS